MSVRGGWALLFVAVGALSGCERERAEKAATSALTAAATASTATSAAPVAPAGDGLALMVKFECVRCHEAPPLEAPPLAKQCVGCHERVLSGKVKASPAEVAKARKNIVSMREVPSLVGTRGRLRREWIEAYLQKPHDLRPNLVATMPRLALGPAEAKAIAAHLAGDEKPEGEAALGDWETGQGLFTARGCATCHAFSAEISGATRPALLKDATPASRLAPDLRHVRDRMTPASLLAWLEDPASMKPDTPMPKPALSARERRDVAAFLLRAPLAPLEAPTFVRLPVLERPVGYDEVRKKVLGKTCVHCHEEPDATMGDGGPGNTGGFGFSGKGLVVGSHAALLAGLVGEDGERTSALRPRKGGGDTPHLVEALLARHDEEAGRPRKGIRGMPLGLPALPADEIQLVETWIAQGAPQ